MENISAMRKEKIKKNLPSLQFITHGDIVGSAQIALENGVKWVQFRCKQAESTQDLLDKMWAVKRMCCEYDAIMTIDDYVFLVDECKADGLHLGKEDMPISQARKIVGNDVIIGGTAHNMEEIRDVFAQGVDYIGLGPFRYTATKQKLSPVLGLQGYSELIKQCREENINIPIYAIGGIKAEDAAVLKATGVYGLAVSGGVIQAESPQEAVRVLSI